MRGPQRGPSRARPSSRSTSSRRSSSARGGQLASRARRPRSGTRGWSARPHGSVSRIVESRARADQLGRAPDRALAVAEVRAEADVGASSRPLDRDGRCTRRSIPAGRTSGLRTRTRTRSPAEALDERVGDRGRERLEQRRSAARRPPRTAARDLAVVDRVLDPVGRAALAHLELDVVEEQLPALALLLARRRGGRTARARAARSSRSAADRPRATRAAPRRARARRARAGSSRRARTRRRPRRPTPRSTRSSPRVAHDPAERALAREADEHRPAERGQLVEPAHELEVVLDRLAEADPGIEADELLADARGDREREPLLEERASPPRRRRRRRGRPASSAARRACASGRGRRPRRRRRPRARGRRAAP